MSEMIHLAGGASVPAYLVEALEEFETVWPGATFHNARPAIVAVLLNELQQHMVDHIQETLMQELKMPTDEAKAFSARLADKLVK
jgi:hypothetical protein